MFYNIIAWALPSKGVDFAIRGLVKASAALNAAEQRQHKQAAKLEARLTVLRDLKAIAVADAARAERIAKKLADLIA